MLKQLWLIDKTESFKTLTSLACMDIISVCGSRMKGELVFEKLRH